MELIGLGVKNHDLTDTLINRLLSRLPKSLYFKILTQTNTDDEVKLGLLNFCTKKEVTVLQFELNDLKISTSYNLSEDLIKQFEGNSSFFLKYLLQECDSLPDQFFLIFAFEWNLNDRVRYLNILPQDLNDYFTINFGWSLMLYDINSENIYADTEIPLIMDVKNVKIINN